MCLDVKGHCSFRGPLLGHTYPPRTVVTGSQMPSPGLCRAHTHLCTHFHRHTHTHTCMSSLVLFLKNIQETYKKGPSLARIGQDYVNQTPGQGRKGDFYRALYAFWLLSHLHALLKYYVIVKCKKKLRESQCSQSRRALRMKIIPGFKPPGPRSKRKNTSYQSSTPCYRLAPFLPPPLQCHWLLCFLSQNTLESTTHLLLE